MITFDEAYESAKTVIQNLEIDVRIISVRPFGHGWIFEYQDTEYLNSCDYLSMLLDTPYILIDKDTQEIFFVYLKEDNLELLLENYQNKSIYIKNNILIPYINNNLDQQQTQTGLKTQPSKVV